ncbi:MAG: S8 family serine peptidase, partial [Anaerolineae bacterium]
VGRPLEALHHYRYALNGVALVIDADEAAVVASLPGVEHVTLSRSQPLLTDAGPAWIGARGVWDGSALEGGVGSKGEGVIVGEVDTGINMDHPSFAAVGGDGYVHENPLGAGNYLGWCDPAHPLHDPAKHICNDKLIGAWSFPESGNDPEDDASHGSHTASTVAGNVLSSTLVAPTVTITRPISGVAPHANIIAYDACNGDCPDSATTAAIDQAVADGVDVINYSIGTSRAAIWSDDNVVMTAFRNARAAGVISSVSAGNSGPGPLTTAAVGPWMTSVGAATHNRVMQNALVDLAGGDTAPPADIVGKGLTAGYGPAPIVYAKGYLKTDGTPDDGGCLTAFPAGTFTGEIVVCDRGDIARTQKGKNVLAGGAGGLILANAAANGASTNADGHSLPAVHITYADGQVLKAWLASGQGHTGTISGTRFNMDPVNGDITAGFSSRGPTRWSACCLRPVDGFYARRWLNILKPDVTGPGVDVWAAYGTDPSEPSPNPEFGFMSGTSMSSPHLTGASALMRGVHPDWTPAEIQSAFMTTAITDGVRKEDGVTPADWFDMGAGRVDVSRAAAAGFVLDMTMAEAMAADPEAGGDPSTLNLASMADFSCLAECGWTRVITSTLDEPVQWLLSTSATPGMTLTVTPAVFTLAPTEGGAMFLVAARRIHATHRVSKKDRLAATRRLAAIVRPIA